MKLAAVLAGTLLPSLALACPQCAAKDDPNSGSLYLLLIAFTVVPYVVGLSVYKAIKHVRAMDEEVIP